MIGWVVRVILHAQQVGPHTARLVEALAAAGVVRLHDVVPGQICVDLPPPAGVDNHQVWAEGAAARLRDHGYSATAAPPW